MPKPRPYTMHAISHTHWDREWYQDFQGYRRRLVFQVDALMDLLERRADFNSFLLDGQTACVLDYLEIRPEQRERLVGHMKAGPIHIGPWFVMPDELLLSGESLVRNLALGHCVCRELGVPPVPVGYVTDIFGHCSQFPQILRGFGIDCAMLHRGTNGEDEQSEMVWEGADGSDVLLIKTYQYAGYNDFLTIRWCNWGEKELRDYEARKIGLATTPVLFSMDGNDHEPAREDTLTLMERVNDAFVQTTCVHSSLPEYLRALREALGDWRQGRRRFRGELRTPAKVGLYNEMMTGAASSRVPLKQANDEAEWLLARAADPMAAWSRVLGGDCQQAFMDLAWRHLLLNHPHDSIVGCSIDQVHRDMMYRFDQARMIGRQTVGESLLTLAERVDTAGLGEDYVVTVANLSSEDSGPLTRFVIECEGKKLAKEQAEGRRLTLLDENGAPLAYDVVRVENDSLVWPLTCKTRGWYRCRPEGYVAHTRLHVAAAVSVPGLGYRTFKVDFAPAGAMSTPAGGPGPVNVDAAARCIENEHVRLDVAADGSVTLTEKATGITYPGLHVFEDRGDVGDGWNHRYPHEDRTVLSTNAAARGPVAVEADSHGPLCGSLRVAFAVRVPADLEPIPGDADRKRRTEATVELEITTTFTLLAGERRIECRTTVNNTARCHRLRVLLPTGRKCDTWLGDTAFDVVERPVAVPDTTGWNEPAREESPIKNVVAARDADGGLAILTRGIQEACVRDNPQREIALTLFRGFVENLYFQPTRDSLLLGEVTVEYAIVPFGPKDEPLASTLMRQVDRYKAALPSCTLLAAPGGALPRQGRFIDVPSPLVLSTIKVSEDRAAVIVRVFNPLDREVTATLRPHFAFAAVATADLLEAATSPLPLTTDGGIAVTLGPKKVLTLRLERA